MICVSAPVPIPPCAEQHSSPTHFAGGERNLIDLRAGRRIDSHDQTFEIGERFECQLGQIFSALITMKGAVDVSPRVCDHLDLADVD